MTHSTINTERENAGSVDVVYHTIDITSLDGAGAEQYDPDAELGLADPAKYGIGVRGQEDPTLDIVWDHVAGELSVTDDAGADVTAGTAVGQVVLEVTGR